MANNFTCNLNEYKCSNRGVIVPLVSEYTWPVTARIILYLIGLLWSFLGVSIIADIFMQSIEMITSKTRLIRATDPNDSNKYVDYEVKIWNSTVANLTLMALGSSAPEILLSCIEIIFNNFTAGDLGPGTIVGSAAVNMLVITGVCISAIPKGEVRRIKAIKVFAVTTFFSCFAYIWLVVILIGHTRGEIDFWEALVTFTMFPALVILAYMADRECFCQKSSVESSNVRISLDRTDETVIVSDMNEDREIKKVIKKMVADPNLSENDVAQITAKYANSVKSHSPAWYRINAIRNMSGGGKLDARLSLKQKKVYKNLTGMETITEVAERDVIDESLAVIDFASSFYAILERDRYVKINITRSGKRKNKVKFRVETVDGTAKANEDYIPLKKTMVFEPEEILVNLKVRIIDDSQWEPDEVFFIRLSVEENQFATVGDKSICQVTIYNDDDAGAIELGGPSVLFRRNCVKAKLPINRTRGADGRVSAKWKTEDISAVEGQDYIGKKGEVVFEHGEISKFIEIPIVNDLETEKDECFSVTLTKTTGGASLGRIVKTVVTIVNDDAFSAILRRVTNLTQLNLDSIYIQSSNWAEQFRNAMNVNGGDVENATSLDYLMHFLTFFWKIMFAIVPPTTICGGWLSFFIALCMIFVVTIIIGDFAAMFGCLIGLKDSVTAITLVALGTSLPDLFASKTAALKEKTADNSIGNVTGSNSVNVFLGLGLPWLIATVYWDSKGKPFFVPEGSLGFSVVIYLVCALCCIVLLVSRRTLSCFGKTELGGVQSLKHLSSVICVLLWLLYIIVSSLQAHNHLPALF